MLRAIVGFVRGSYVDRAGARRAIDGARRLDPVGDRVHTALACVACACVAGPVSAIELGVLPLAAWFVIRFPSTRRIWIHGFGQPAVLAVLALASWMAVSLLWSERPIAGAEHIAQLRWILLVPLLYPVIDRRGALLGALAVGLALGHAAQIVDFFDGFGIHWLGERLRRDPARVSGWWDPAVGGSVLVAALGIHLAPAIGGRGAVRWVGLSGVLVSGLAIFATGTRGAWIASALLVPIAMVVRGVASGARTRDLAPGIGALGAALVVGWLVFGEHAGARIDTAREDLARAIDGDLDSFDGARVSMALGALDAGAAHPIHGLGAGGYRDFMRAHTDLAVDDAAHAHNLILHWFAELGLVGVALGALVLVVPIANAARGAQEKGPWGYSRGPLIALIGLVIVSGVSTITIDVNTAAMLGVLAALAPVPPGDRVSRRSSP